MPRRSQPSATPASNVRHAPKRHERGMDGLKFGMCQVRAQFAGRHGFTHATGRSQFASRALRDGDFINHFFHRA